MASYPSCSEARREAGSKWSDVIKNSERIPNKTLEVYQLETVKEDLNENGQVRRVTFGKMDPKIRNRTVIVVGESGSGKSSLINMMLNYMLGVKWEDKVRFQIISEEDDGPQTESQTTAITAYEIFGLEGLTVPFSLTIIDTPGYGDTRGLEQDKEIAENLYKLLKSVNGVQQMTAACVVVKSTVNRLNPSQKYIFKAVLSLFGKDMEKNILTLITFSNWLKPINALDAIKKSGVPFRQDENEEPVYFLFDNSPFEKPEKRFEKKSKSNWYDGMESFAELFQALDRMETQNLQMTKNVLKERKRLEANIQSLVGQIKDTQLKHVAHKKHKEILERHKDEMRESKNFTYTYTTVVIEEREIQEEATRCPECKFNCHYPGCWWVLDLSWCTVMSDGKCTVCPNKCSYKVHIKDKKMYAAVKREKTGTYEALRRKTEGIIASAEEVMSDLEQNVKEAEAEMIQLIEQCYHSVLQLEKYALKFHSEDTRKTILSLIDNLKVINDTGKVRELERLFKDTL